MTSFSIIICTYNPRSEILQRLLNAVLQFSAASPVHEVILVDNNSAPSLATNQAVSSFLAASKNATLIVEQTPGLTAARLAGIHAAVHNWIVFFDDDNEPAADYLLKVDEAIQQYATVAAWGPGTVEVEYLTEGASWLNEQKHLFQQRNETQTAFDNKQHWQAVYPYGTGMVVKKEVALEYRTRVNGGRYTLSDRKGKSLSSGGDVQLVLTAISMGFAAGVVKGLSLRHLIDAAKANLSYLLKQEYGTATAYIKAFNQVFPEAAIAVQPGSSVSIIKKIYSAYRIHRPRMNKQAFYLHLSSVLGEFNAGVYANGYPKPLVLKLYEKIINA
jgi:glycosyltransferase involved in cell wall biosynthesis